jgi:hypothetical protein
VDSPHPSVELGVQFLQLVLDLSLGLAADLLAEPLPARAEANRNHTAPPSGTGSVVNAVPAVRAVIEVDAVVAVATALRLSQVTKRQLTQISR